MKYIISLMVLLQSCGVEKPITITEFSTYSKPVSTTLSLGKELIYYNNFFLVSNFRDTKKIGSKLDSFVVDYISKHTYSPHTDEIRLYFYKETSKTNLIAIERNPREIDRYSNDHDLIYCYAVKLDGNKVREKFKNGEVIETTEKLPPKPKFTIIQQ